MTSDKVTSLDSGEFPVVPNAFGHRSVAAEGAETVLIEPEETLQTNQTVAIETQEWI